MGVPGGSLLIVGSFQDDKDSDSSKETLDDLFPNDDDDPGQGSKWEPVWAGAHVCVCVCVHV